MTCLVAALIFGSHWFHFLVAPVLLADQKVGGTAHWKVHWKVCVTAEPSGDVSPPPGVGVWDRPNKMSKRGGWRITRASEKLAVLRPERSTLIDAEGEREIRRKPRIHTNEHEGEKRKAGKRESEKQEWNGHKRGKGRLG